MAFHFTLAVVLRYRKSLEEREELLLQELLASRGGLLRQLQQNRDAFSRLQEAMQHGLQQEPTPAVEVQFSLARLGSIQRRQESLQLQLSELEVRIAEQTERYRRQRRNREVLESLRDRQLDDYRIEQKRREQASLDELYLLRRSREKA